MRSHDLGIKYGSRRPLRTALVVFLAAVVSALAFDSALSEPNFPAKPIQIFVPYGAGGVADLTMRLLAQKLTERTKQQVVIENRPGAGGLLAVKEVLRARADGYTLGVIGNGQAIGMSLFKARPYNVLTDFTFVSMTARFEMLLAVKVDSPFKTLPDVVTAARKDPGKLNFGAINPGSTQNLSAHLLKQVTGIDVAIVPYKTTPDLVTAVLRGDVDVGFDFYAGFQAVISDNQVRIIADFGRGAQSAVAGCSHRKGKRLSPICRDQLEWSGLSGRNAGRNTYDTQPAYQCLARRSRPPGHGVNAGHGRSRQYARGNAQPHGLGCAEVGRGDRKGRDRETMTQQPRLKIAVATYGHTKAIKSGAVAIAGIEPDFVEVAPIIGAFRRMVRDVEFDVCEMAPTTYMIARALGAPFIALPIFLMRRFHHGGFVVRPDSGIKVPKDLEGKKVGVRAYSVTTGVWTRGIFINEYGLDSSKVTWVVDDEEHVTALKLPPNVVHAPEGKSLQSMMKAGEIQAGFTGPAGVGRAGPPDQRLGESQRGRCRGGYLSGIDFQCRAGRSGLVSPQRHLPDPRAHGREGRTHQTLSVVGAFADGRLHGCEKAVP